MKRALLLILMTGALAGCASTRAQTPPEDHPTLAVPPVPPRVIDPLPSGEPPAIEPVTDLPGAPAAPPRPRPPAREAARPETKPEAKPDAPPDPATAQPPVPSPVPPLRTPGTADPAEVARQVLTVIDRTVKLLEGIDYQKLGEDRRVNYNHAKNFTKQAEEALKKNDVVLAKSLADRAETIARALAGG
jgi:hypothetical protein